MSGGGLFLLLLLLLPLLVAPPVELGGTAAMVGDGGEPAELEIAKN